MGGEPGARIIDGKAAAAEVRAEVASDVSALKAAGVTAGLAVVLVGDDPASEIYVRNKGRAAAEVGIASFEHHLGKDAGEDQVIGLVEELNLDRRVHGILVQFPVPGQISQQAVIDAIDPAKDVDGLHPDNAGRLASGLDALVPCTPQGCMILIRSVQEHLAGSHAVVIGRSNLVGKPVAQLLLAADCTVTLGHSRSRDLGSHARRADILVVAVGRPGIVPGDWVRPGAIVIDVGMNRIPAPERGAGRTRLVGDVDFEAARRVAGAITPVPGGVGPMTVACLMRNTVAAARRQSGLTG